MSIEAINLENEILKKILEVYEVNRESNLLIMIDVDAALDGRFAYKKEFVDKYNGGKLKITTNVLIQYGMDLSEELERCKAREKHVVQETTKADKKISFLELIVSFFRKN